MIARITTPNQEKIQITECPFCGSIEGLFQKYYVSGWVMKDYNYKGQDEDRQLEGETYQNLTTSKQGKYLYCLSCKKKVIKVSDCA